MRRLTDKRLSGEEGDVEKNHRGRHRESFLPSAFLVFRDLIVDDDMGDFYQGLREGEFFLETDFPELLVHLVEVIGVKDENDWKPNHPVPEIGPR